MPDSLRLQENLDNRVAGFIELANGSGIYGWAYDREAPDKPVSLLFFIDDTLIAEIPCTAYRPDVERGGHGSANAGFHVTIPRDYCDGQQHRYVFTSTARRPVCLHALGGTAEIVRSFRYNVYFDYAFYKQFYADTRHMSRHDAFQNWAAALGTPDERFANEELLLKRLETPGNRLPADFSAVLFRFLTSAAGGDGTSGEAVAQFLRARDRPELAGHASSHDYRAACDERLYTSFRNFLRGHGFTSDRFLSCLNVSDYSAMNPGLGLLTKLQCAQHFVTTGCQALAALSFGHRFDYPFLAEYDSSYAALPPAQAYLRWLNEGIADALPPNRRQFLADLRLSDTGDFPADFDAGIYLARNPDLKTMLPSRWAALAHYINTGAVEGRAGCEVVPAVLDVHRAAADSMAVAGQLQPARRLYERVLELAPGNALALRHYGDCLLRLEESSLAAGVYERTIAAGADNKWTYINLAICLTRLERWAAAAAVLLSLCEHHPGDRALWERYEAASREAFEALAREANWRGEQGFYEQGRAKMREACAVLAAPFKILGTEPNRARAKIQRLAIVADVGLAQCNFYRVQQKREQAELAGLSCQIFNYVTEAGDFAAAVPQFDAAIFYRVPATPDVMSAIFRARKAGLPVFYEIDDLMFDEALYPDSFESYAGQISHELYATLVNGPIALKTALSVCDYALASTPALASAMQPHVLSQKAFVHRNALGPLHEAAWRAPRFAHPAGVVRVFYGTGTAAHNEDFARHLAPQLAGLLKKWGKKLELYIIGYLTLPACLKPHTGQITLAGPNWDLKAYWRMLGEMDISLAVLSPGLLTDCKSEIKWLEAAMLGIPSVVSATSTYCEVVTHERTGMLVHDDEQWFTGLDALIGDAKKRGKIGAAAREAVLRDYVPAAMAANLTALLAEVTAPPPRLRRKRKKILLTHVFFYPQLIGGATRVVMDNLCDMMEAHGSEFEFEIFTTIEGAGTAYQYSTTLWEGCRVHAVTTPQLADLESRVWDERMGAAFATVLERFQPDLVHFHCLQRITLSAPQAARARNIPYVITAHDGWWLSDEQFLVDAYGAQEIYDFAKPMEAFRRGGSERLERLRAKQVCLNEAEHILAVSAPFAALYRAQGFGNVITVENGVSQLPAVRRAQSADGRVRLAHIGGARPHKGYHLVQAALSAGAYQNLSLLVIDHEMDPATTRNAMWGSTPVTLRGKFAQGDVSALYGQIDVLLAPSVWPESYGLVAREAALAGCWVIASDRGAIGQDVTPETGFIVDVSSTAGLAAAFAEINANPQRFLQSPPPPAAPRPARAQAGELAQLYGKLVG